MTLQPKDFVEIEFTGKLTDGTIFDSNVKKDIESADLKVEAKPFIFSLGQGMFLKGVDDYLIGKDTGKEYTLELSAKDAFGLRDPKLVQIAPIKLFSEQKIMPQPGALFNFDGKIGKILSVNGGRVSIDFNNPLAGKDVVYNLKVLRKVEDLNEKVNSFNEFIFKKKFEFEVAGKELLMKVEKPLLKFVELFKEKFKELFDLDLQIKEIEEEAKK